MDDTGFGLVAGILLATVAAIIIGSAVARPPTPCIKWQGRWEAAVAPADQIDLLADRPRGCPLPEVSP